MRAARTALALLAASGGAFAAFAPFPAAAQVRDRIVEVYGDEACPANNGQEIVVCRRLPARERYRIPRDLRESEVAPQALGGNAVAAVNSTGGTGTQVQSCNAIGAGVNAGCVKQGTNVWRAERNAQRAAEESIP